MKTNMILWFGAVALAGAAWAANYTTTTPAGRAFTMDVTAERITGATKEVTICGDRVDLIKRVKLWMPEHGHGSSPTQFAEISEGCRVVSKVNFTMPGEWEVRVELTDGDVGVFLVEVDRSN